MKQLTHWQSGRQQTRIYRRDTTKLQKGSDERSRRRNLEEMVEKLDANSAMQKKTVNS